MATITPTNLRAKRQDSSLYLSILQPVALLTGQINGSFSRGARSLDFDNGTGTGFATIEAGQTLEIDTAFGIAYARVKSITGSQVSGTIIIGENDIFTADNQVIRIKHEYKIWAIPPSIRSQIFYKDYSITYTNQNSLVNPVAIIGPHRVGILSAGSVVFALNSSSSYAIAQGATISSRVWSCLHMGGATTDISFSSTTTANPTLTITAADQYWLKCTVTDSNGKTQDTYRALFVYADVKDAYNNFTVSSLSGDWNQSGWQCSIDATGAVTLADFPDGALVCLWHVNKFDAIEGYINLWGTASQQIVCSGYLRKDQDNDNFQNGTGHISFSVTTPDALMDNVSEMGSISINATASPTKWYQYASWLTVGRGVHHLLKWHSSVLETCDVLGLTDNVLGAKSIDFSEPTILQMINTLGYQRGHFAKLVSNRMGQLYFVTDSQMLNTAARAALDTVFTLTTADVSGVVDVVRSPEANVSLADLDGFSFNGTTSTPFISLIPGYREASISYGLPGYRGGGNISTKSQVLDDQTDSNEKVGRVFAQANNNPYEIRLTTPTNYLGAFDVVPSIGWYAWGISDSALKRNTSLNGILLICRNVSHQINHQAGTIQTSVVFEPEAIGPDGIQGNYPVGYPTVTGGGVSRAPSWDDSNAGSPTLSFVITGYADNTDDGNIVAGNVGPLALDTSTVYDTDAIVAGKVCAISTTQAVVVYQDNTDNKIKARVANVSNSVITSIGTAYDVDTFGVGLTDAVAISASTAMVLYDGDIAVMLSISGDVVSVGTPLTLSSSVTGSSNLCRLTSTSALYIWNASPINGVILTISGATITEGTTYAAADFGGGVKDVIALDTTTALIAYHNETSNNLDISLLYNIAGDSISHGGTELTIAGPLFTFGEINICRASATTALVSWIEPSDTLSGVIVSWNGSLTLSNGSTVTISTGTNARYAVSAGMGSATLAVVAYIYRNDANTNFLGVARSLTISGTTITNNNDEITIKTYATAGTIFIDTAVLNTL